MTPPEPSSPQPAPAETPLPPEQFAPAKRVAFVRTVSELNPGDFALLVTAIAGASSHVSRQGTVPEQAAELICWAEGPTGCGLKTIEVAFTNIRRWQAKKANPASVVQQANDVFLGRLNRATPWLFVLFTPSFNAIVFKSYIQEWLDYDYNGLVILGWVYVIIFGLPMCYLLGCSAKKTALVLLAGLFVNTITMVMIVGYVYRNYPSY